MTGLDARFLYSETATAHMHTIKVAVVDLAGRTSPLTEDSLLGLLGDRLDRLALLRRRAVSIPLHLGHPVWIDDPGFDLRDHVRWRRAPQPGGDRELATIVAEVASRRLRTDRPLWNLTVVDGLADDRVAFVIALHHCLADGGAAVALLSNVFAAADGAVHLEPPRPEPIPSSATLLRRALGAIPRRAAALPDLARRTARGVLAARRVRRATSIRVPLAFAGPRTPLNVSLDADRTYAMTSLPLDDLLAVRTATSSTLNDVFLAVCGGALRRYLDRRGPLPGESLVAGVPVATKRGTVRFSGNHVDNLMVPIRTDLADPVTRLRAIHEASAAAREVREALGTDLFEDRASQIPPLLFPFTQAIWARSGLADRLRPPLNLVASNVRGPDELPEIDGGVVTDLYSVGPILEGIGLNLTAWTHRGRLQLSVLGCPSSLPDPWELVSDLRASAAELVEAARHHPGAPPGDTIDRTSPITSPG